MIVITYQIYYYKTIVIEFPNLNFLAVTKKKSFNTNLFLHGHEARQNFFCFLKNRINAIPFYKIQKYLLDWLFTYILVLIGRVFKMKVNGFLNIIPKHLKKKK